MSLPTAYPGILISIQAFRIKGFIDQCKLDLDLLANTTSVGADLLRLIGLRHAGTGTTAGHTITIGPNLEYRPGEHTTFTTEGFEDSGGRNQAYHTLASGVITNYRMPGSQMVGDKKVTGSSCTVSYINTALEPGIEALKTTALGVRTPAWVSLAHELIHGFHLMSGDAELTSVKGVVREELYTTGVGVYANTRISDNAIRKAAGLPLRPCYYQGRDESVIESRLKCGFLSQSVGGSAYREGSFQSFWQGAMSHIRPFF
jgi:hypothetical protein